MSYSVSKYNLTQLVAKASADIAVPSKTSGL